jgi:NADH-quinone oxidoreductase subunit M
VAVIGFAGLVFTVIFLLHMVQRTLFGETRDRQIRLQAVADLTARELAILIPLAGAVLFIGLHPGPILTLLEEALKEWIPMLR